ncbi:MAG TPA: nitrous oxide reductase, partial [Pricia sp.]|nr:nitrous oxide reductase [Pricia sp.]
MKRTTYLSLTLLALATVFTGCKDQGEKSNGALSSNAAERVYVEPGKYDEFYAFLSGGFSGQLAVYGIPSGRLLKVVPVFSQDPEKAYGYNEETKPMLNTTFG